MRPIVSTIAATGLFAALVSPAVASNICPSPRIQSLAIQGNYRITTESQVVDANGNHIGWIPAGTVVQVKALRMICPDREFWLTDWGFVSKYGFF